GEISRLDQRADVFSLGAILCEILTGRPPYTDGDRMAVQRQARRAELAGALARVDACATDAGVVGLARRCLSAEPDGRPCDAGEVARSVEAYLASVEERARRAELERVAEEARAAEAQMTAAHERKAREAAQAQAAAERRARRLTLGLAAAVMLLIV